jgi:aspartyl aminopeptidase
VKGADEQESLARIGHNRSMSATELARDLCAFVDASPTPHHAAREAARRLEAVGYRSLDERDAWSLQAGDKRYFVRGGGTLVAFQVGRRAPAESGFRVVGAHTDSPNLRVKPSPNLARAGFRQVALEPYGGVILATWLDRDLSIAGEVVVRDGSRLSTRLVDFRRPVARIPNLAIHLNRGVNKEGLVVNEQRHLPAIVGLGKEGDLERELSAVLEVERDTILGWDLSLYDVQPASLFGFGEELIDAPRLDNLASCHAALAALIASAGDDCDATRVVVLYDHEECGSRSAQGAVGTVLRDTLTRLVEGSGDRHTEGLVRATQRSFLVSADMAHAVHPNHEGQHDPQHAPSMGGGMVLKVNSNQSYATSGRTGALLEHFARELGRPLQRFVVRSDLPCGSTIGPIAAANLGIPTVDVGAPMLAMHSCREMAGRDDVASAVALFRRALTSPDPR